MKDYDWTEEKKTYHIRVRITYEDIVDIEAHDLRSASIEAEKYVFANMNGGDDPIEPTIDIENWTKEKLDEYLRNISTL